MPSDYVMPTATMTVGIGFQGRTSSDSIDSNWNSDDPWRAYVTKDDVVIVRPSTCRATKLYLLSLPTFLDYDEDGIDYSSYPHTEINLDNGRAGLNLGPVVKSAFSRISDDLGDWTAVNYRLALHYPIGTVSDIFKPTSQAISSLRSNNGMLIRESKYYSSSYVPRGNEGAIERYSDIGNNTDLIYFKFSSSPPSEDLCLRKLVV